jgi:hypothetical protein
MAATATRNNASHISSHFCHGTFGDGRRKKKTQSPWWQQCAIPSYWECYYHLANDNSYYDKRIHQSLQPWPGLSMQENQLMFRSAGNITQGLPNSISYIFNSISGEGDFTRFDTLQRRHDGIATEGEMMEPLKRSGKVHHGVLGGIRLCSPTTLLKRWLRRCLHSGFVLL